MDVDSSETARSLVWKWSRLYMVTVEGNGEQVLSWVGGSRPVLWLVNYYWVKGNKKANQKPSHGEILSHQILFYTSVTGNLTFPLWKDFFFFFPLVKKWKWNESSNWASETLLAWCSSTLGLPFILWFACSSAWTPRGDNNIWQMCSYHQDQFRPFLVLLRCCCS